MGLPWGASGLPTPPRDACTTSAPARGREPSHAAQPTLSWILALKLQVPKCYLFHPEGGRWGLSAGFPLQLLTSGNWELPLRWAGPVWPLTEGVGILVGRQRAGGPSSPLLASHSLCSKQPA